MSKETVRVPDIGGVDAAEVVEVLVAVGDTIEREQGLVVLESDKASLEIPSTAAGTVVELLASEGAQLAEGDPVAVVETGADDADSAASDPVQEDVAVGGDEAAVTAKDNVAASADEAAPPASDSAAAASGAGETATVSVPDIGTEDAVDVVEVSISVGATISEGDTLIVLESDKASMEVPSSLSGTVTEVLVAEGQQVRQGDAVVKLQTTGGAAVTGQRSESPAVESADKQQEQEKSATAPAPPAQAKTEPDVATSAAPAALESAAGTYAGPAVRRLAREFGVPLDKVSGSGPRGRVLKEDLHQYVQRTLEAPRGAGGGAALPEVPEIDFAQFGPVEVEKRGKIDRLTASNMQRSWLNVPHVTQFDDIDITELEAFRKSLKGEGESRGVKLTPVPFLLKACAAALKRNPKLNASLSDGGDSLTFKQYVHIGMAVDTPAGLVVPVIRDVDRKSLWELAAEVLDFAARARDRKLKPQEMQGGCFTVSSLGAIGGRGFTPIVNTPEVGILGVGMAKTQPVWDGQQFQPRLTLPVSLSYDHRVVNGGDGGRFLTDVRAILEDLRRLLL